MWLQIRLYLLLGLMFAIVYAMIAAVAGSMGISSFAFYGVLASGMILVQYMIGPKMVEWSMGIRYVSESEYPSRAMNELRELSQIDKDKSGTIDQHELMMLSTKKVKVSTSDKIMELMGTHPNMVKRIHRLSKIAG